MRIFAIHLQKILRACAVGTLIFSFVGVLPAAALIPSDPLYREQWYLPKVHAEGAWDITTGSPDVVIAVIDSGVDVDHVDLKPNLWVNTKEISGNGFNPSPKVTNSSGSLIAIAMCPIFVLNKRETLLSKHTASGCSGISSG